jgi:hypothetical protein
MERGSIDGEGPLEEQAKRRRHNVSTSQGGSCLDIEKTAVPLYSAMTMR